MLGAISYDDGSGDDVDFVINAIVDRMHKEGLRMVGAVKDSETKPGRTRCDMSLKDLSTGEIIPISQNLGAEAKGCSLDAGALEKAVGLTLAGLERGSDFLVLNRFGKREELGHGFRSAIENAACQNIPCLVGLGEKHVQAWHGFTDRASMMLPCEVEQVWNWCREVRSRAGMQDAAREHP